MAVYFFDSSGIVKRYVEETGTDRIVELTRPEAGHRIYLGRIAGAEVVSALTRLKQAGHLSEEDGKNAIEQFRQDFSKQYQIIEITSELIERAMSLAEKHALRGYDAVQLATAVEVQKVCKTLNMSGPIMVSSDEALNEAAKKENIVVEDPNILVVEEEHVEEVEEENKEHSE